MRKFIPPLLTAIAALSGNAQSTTDTIFTRHLDEVIVTGSNDAINQNLLPYSVSVIGEKRLESTGNTQLLSAVSGLVPGLFVSERNILGFGISNGGSGGIKIRGIGGAPTNAVLMMVDGQPQFAGIYSHHVADFYQTEYVDHVEVLRGPASVLYGSNAMGGVINVITRHATVDGVRTTLKSQFGSYRTWQNSITNTTRYGKFSSLVSASYDRTDGVKKNFDFKQSSVYAKTVYELSSYWHIGADYSLMQFKGNDPVYPKLTDPKSTDIYRQNVIRGEASISTSNRYRNSNGTIRAYYSYGNHFIDDPRHFHSLDDRMGLIAYQNIKPWNNANATIGFDFDRYTGKIPISGGSNHSEGSITTMSRKKLFEYSPYVTLAQSLWGDRLILNAGLRMTGSNKFKTRLIPQAGFVVRHNSLTLRASAAKGFRNPSFREMYLYRTANPDLEPESMMNYEIAAGKHFSRYLDIEVTAYYSKGSDMIQTVSMKNVNTGGFINKGIEISARSHPAKTLQLWAAYSYLHSSLSGLTAAPKNQYYLGAGWDALPKLHVDATIKGVGGLFVADDVRKQNYTTVNLRTSYLATLMLELFINLDNITDTGYMINKGYPMPGFTVTSGFKFSI